jgi:hypothetical protein
MPVTGSNTFAIFTALDIIFTVVSTFAYFFPLTVRPSLSTSIGAERLESSRFPHPLTCPQTNCAPPRTRSQIFTAELSLNLFAYWFWPFFSSGWHVFDFFVVTSKSPIPPIPSAAPTPPVRVPLCSPCSACTTCDHCPPSARPSRPLSLMEEGAAVRRVLWSLDAGCEQGVAIVVHGDCMLVKWRRSLRKPMDIRVETKLDAGWTGSAWLVFSWGGGEGGYCSIAGEPDAERPARDLGAAAYADVSRAAALQQAALAAHPHQRAGCVAGAGVQRLHHHGANPCHLRHPGCGAVSAPQPGGIWHLRHRVIHGPALLCHRPPVAPSNIHRTSSVSNPPIPYPSRFVIADQTVLSASIQGADHAGCLPILPSARAASNEGWAECALTAHPVRCGLFGQMFQISTFDGCVVPPSFRSPAFSITPCNRKTALAQSLPAIARPRPRRFRTSDSRPFPRHTISSRRCAIPLSVLAAA